MQKHLYMCVKVALLSAFLNDAASAYVTLTRLCMRLRYPVIAVAITCAPIVKCRLVLMLADPPAANL